MYLPSLFAETQMNDPTHIINRNTTFMFVNCFTQYTNCKNEAGKCTSDGA